MRSTIMEFPVRDTLILAIIVLFFGQYLTRKISVLAKYNIPEPVWPRGKFRPVDAR